MDSLGNLPSDFKTALTLPISSFRLLDLPDELWLHILALSLTRPYSINVASARTNRKQTLLVAQPAVTRTCRRLRTEGLKLFYGLNIFEAQHLDLKKGACADLNRGACARHWLAAIGNANLRAMGFLYFHSEIEPAFWVKQFGLCEIEVSVREADGTRETVSRGPGGERSDRA